MMKFVSVILFTMLGFATAMAQVTTSGMNGRVTTEQDEPIAGVVIIALHVPSGTEYVTASDAKGYYNLQNMRPGGPYRVTAKMLGFRTVVTEGIRIALGDNYLLDIKMPEEAIGLDEVVVTGSRDRILNSGRTGASTNITGSNLTQLPTISRSLSDFTRLTPQAGTNSAFAGRDGRYNNIMIDGASFNNRFGLTTNNMPGGSAQPISLDAIQEVTVNLSPFDVRESNFTGASVNAVTRSGDNQFEGSVYTYFRPKSFTGNKVNGVEVKDAKTRTSQMYGARFGGPIIKDKLFYFVSGEWEKSSSPGIAWSPSTDGIGNSKQMISRTTVADLERVKAHLLDKYHYDPGVYENFNNFVDQDYKIMARLDWNISDKHKLTLRFNYVNAESDKQVNANSGPPGLARKSTRYGVNSMTFSNSNYKEINRVASITGELNSTFSPRISNKLLVAYTSVIDPRRESPSAPFPFVDIWKGEGDEADQYMSFGYELFTYHNEVKTSSLILTDNMNVSLGKHTLLAGASFERQYVYNSYIREGLSYYRYASVDDFINNAKPIGFGLTYPFGNNEIKGMDMTFGMFSFYLQDSWQVNPKFRLTGGLRFEVPIYFSDISQGSQTVINGVGAGGTNQALNDIRFAGGKYVDLGVWPRSRMQVSPRIGFNWDINGDRTVQLRGGTGLFTGLIPFVWFTNQPSSGGYMQSPEVALTAAKIPDNFRFESDYRKQIANYPNLFPSNPGIVASGSSFAKVADDFKLPQVWRTSLAADIQLPWTTVLTLEAIVTKDVNAVVQKNLNCPIPNGGLFAGADRRPYWSTKNVDGNVSSMMLLTNASQGYQAAFTAQLTKRFQSGLSGMVAYTYTVAKDLGANPGSAAFSAWQSNVAVNSLNYPGMSWSKFAMPHRVNGFLTYRVEYARHLATTLSLYYEGSHSGRISYTYTNDFNGDGNASDLMYIPKDRSEIQFVDTYKTDDKGNFVLDGQGNKIVTYSAADQTDDFFKYIDDTKYLRKNKGKYAERFGALKKWVSRWDVKVLQDVFTGFGTDKRYSLQVSLDILNIGNLLNSKWGAYDYYGLSSYDNVRPLTYVAGRGTSEPPTFRLNAKDRASFQNLSRPSGNLSTSSTWGMMLGIRLNF